jgi:hypothetical protein
MLHSKSNHNIKNQKEKDCASNPIHNGPPFSLSCHTHFRFSFAADSLRFLNRLYPAASLCATCHIVFPALFRYNKQTTDGDFLNPRAVFMAASCFHNISGGFRHIFPFV